MELNIVLESDFKKLNEKVDKLLEYFSKAHDTLSGERTYSNKEMMKKLDVCSKTLHHYRQSGLLKYSQAKRKITYTESAVQEFLKQHYVHKNKSYE